MSTVASDSVADLSSGGGMGRHAGRVALTGLVALALVSVPLIWSARNRTTVSVTAASSGGASAGSQLASQAKVAAAVPRIPYDPSKPVNLSGVPGVTPEQQHAAEALVRETIAVLPQFADPVKDEALGFVSIHDGVTGDEHFVNASYINDSHILDPHYPESLVFDTSSGTRKLAAAMYMLPDRYTLNNVPNIGGALMQFHIHDNLCFTTAGAVAGLTDAQGHCAPGLVKPHSNAMIHVWIVPHACGPFAALEGIGAGQIKPGETKLCDHVHSSNGF